MPTGSNKFNVTGCSRNENKFTIANAVSSKKLKYLKKNSIPKQKKVDPIIIILREIRDFFFSIRIAAKYETNIVDKISVTYFGFQLM